MPLQWHPRRCKRRTMVLCSATSKASQTKGLLGGKEEVGEDALLYSPMPVPNNTLICSVAPVSTEGQQNRFLLLFSTTTENNKERKESNWSCSFATTTTLQRKSSSRRDGGIIKPSSRRMRGQCKKPFSSPSRPLTHNKCPPVLLPHNNKTDLFCNNVNVITRATASRMWYSFVSQSLRQQAPMLHKWCVASCSGVPHSTKGTLEHIPSVALHNKRRTFLKAKQRQKKPVFLLYCPSEQQNILRTVTLHINWRPIKQISFVVTRNNDKATNEISFHCNNNDVVTATEWTTLCTPQQRPSWRRMWETSTKETLRYYTFRWSP